jgi:glycosyltransferase involved in cell wall biosynthesis
MDDTKQKPEMSISICMTTHNGEKFLKEQLDSILLQLDNDDELIISDDASSDRTLEILQSYQPRIKILSSIKFNSPSKNFEYALSHCQNEIIFLADQDDIWHPEKIKLMAGALNQGFDLVVCDCRLVDENQNVIASSFFELNKSAQGLINNFTKNSFVGCCMAFHRRILIKVMPIPEQILMHDQWIGLIAQKYFKVKFIPQILVDHRRHSNNYSTTGGRSKNSFRKKVISRINLAKMLLQR